MLKRRAVTLADLATRDAGPDLSPGDIARIVHFAISEGKVRADIDRGVLLAHEMPCGRRLFLRVSFLAARRYLTTLGLLPSHADTR